ncbi:MAG: thymidine kinase [Deltaproteobacteria bacterium]|nr:thymidine kinase [Deltaproteobacteria bacterium]
MAKLYFRHGAMGSAKTLNLLAVRHNYIQQGKRVLLMKPVVDTRFGAETIRSRAGLEVAADLVLRADSRLDFDALRGLHCILVDECQFLSAALVEELREVTRVLGVPVIAYGLRTDFRTNLFEGSRRLMELADSVEEVKTTCMFCNRKAVFNLRHNGTGRALLDGPSIQLGADETYSPVCYPCYHGHVEATASVR